MFMSVYQTQVEGKILSFIEPSLLSMGFEIVRVKIMHGRSDTLQIMIDRVDGQSISIDDCELVSRHVSIIMDVEDPIEEEYRLEVSSPGLERPLTREKDFINNVGKDVKLVTYTPINSRKRFSGKISSIDNTTLNLEVEGMVDYAYIELRNISECHITLPKIEDKKSKTKSKR